MDLKQTGLGALIFLIFLAFQFGALDFLGAAAFIVGVIIFSILLWAIGKVSAGKASAEMKLIWKFTTVFAIVLTLFPTFLGPFVGAVFPPDFGAAMLTPLVLAVWLSIFGAAMFATGFYAKFPVTMIVGLIWLLAAVHMPSLGPNAWLHFAVITGFPFIIYGLVEK